MALPIKDTPVLRGEDAREFQRQIAVSGRRAISKEALARIEASHKLFQMLFNGNQKC